MMKSNIETRIRQNNELLLAQSANFDNAKYALQWLQKHFSLLLTRHTLSREIFECNTQLSRLQMEPQSRESRSQMTSYRNRLHNARTAVNNTTQYAQQVRREALGVGLQYLDSNMTGFIEPSDVPSMSADLFTRLDFRNKHKISVSDLQNAVDRMEKNIDVQTKRIVEGQGELRHLEDQYNSITDAETNDKSRTRSESLHAEILKKHEHLNALILQRDFEENMVRETWSLFQRGFVDSLFNKFRIRDDMRSQYEGLVGDLDEIQRHMRDLELQTKGVSTTPANVSEFYNYGGPNTDPSFASKYPFTSSTMGTSTKDLPRPTADTSAPHTRY
jgi:hypothetical protein